MTSPANSAQVVVIGGGIAGCSVAYHLGLCGVTDVLVLERSTLSSGTTWHSTGNMETYRDDPLIFEMVRYAAELYPRLVAASGGDIGWRNVGRVMYTDREERWAVLQTLPELGRARGIELKPLSPADVGRRLPIIATEGLVGGLWVPSDARVNATDAVMAFASAAKSRGVRFRTDCSALRIVTRDGAVCGVETGAGLIECGTVVIAAGLWSAEVARSAGCALPLHALEHQYLITKPCGLDRGMPLFLSYDDQLYGREEVGGLMVGSLDDDAIPLSAAELPQNFSFALLNERWEQFEPYMARAMRRFPLLRNAEIKMLLNGPESFTPDGQMLLGPVPGASGLFAACGFNSNGIALSPAAGRFVAEWIVEGEPSADVAKLDVRRFSAAQADERYLRARVAEIPGYHCRLHAADADYTSARDYRLSPLHAELAAAGARFGTVNGWERALWIARGADDRDWPSAAAGEAEAAATATLMIDRSADVKIVIPDADLADAVAAAAAGGWAGAGLLLPLAAPGGSIEALVRPLRESRDAVLLTAAPDQEARVAEWLRRRQGPKGRAITDATAAYALLELIGPGRHELLAQVTGSSADGAAPAATPASARDADRVCVHEDATADASLVVVAAEHAVALWRRLLAAGAARGLRVGGHFAQEALRIRRGVPAFGREATPARRIAEIARAGARGDAGAPEARIPRTHRARRLAAFASPLDLQGFGSGEAILLADRTVGEITSRVRLPGWKQALALGLLDAGVESAGALELVAGGRRWPLEPRRTLWSAGP